MVQFTFEEINLICCFKSNNIIDIIADMTRTIPYMEQEMQAIAEQSLDKLKKITENDFIQYIYNSYLD